MQQAIVQPGALDLDSLSQNEGPLKLTAGDAAVNEDAAIPLLTLPAADYQLVVLLGDVEVIHREPGHSQGDAELAVAGLLYVVGWVSLGVFLHPVEHLLQVIEAKEQW